MSLQQLEAFLVWAQDEPALMAPLAVAPDAAAVAALAHAAGFSVSADDLLLAAGEPPEVVRMVEIVSLAGHQPQSELEAFLQLLEIDLDLQRVVAAAPDVEGLAAVARVAGFAVTADQIWAASDEEPVALLEADRVLEFWPDLAEQPATPSGTGSGAEGREAAVGAPSSGIATGGSATVDPQRSPARPAAEPGPAAPAAPAAREASAPGSGPAQLADPWSSSGPSS